MPAFALFAEDMALEADDPDLASDASAPEDNTSGTVLDVSGEGPLRLSNERVCAETGLQSGTVEFLDDLGKVVGSHNYEGVEHVVLLESDLYQPACDQDERDEDDKDGETDASSDADSPDDDLGDILAMMTEDPDELQHTCEGDDEDVWLI